MPEPKGSFQDDASVTRASTPAGRSELVRRRSLRAATGIICEGRTVSAILIQFETGGGGGGNRRTSGSSRNGWRLRDRNAVVSLIRRAPRVLSTEVCVNIQFWRRVPLQLPERMGRSDQGGRTIGTERQIRELGGPVAGNAISRRALNGKVQLLCNHGNAYVGSDATAVPRIVER